MRRYTSECVAVGEKTQARAEKSVLLGIATQIVALAPIIPSVE
jgi:hypothetical protein